MLREGFTPCCIMQKVPTTTQGVEILHWLHNDNNTFTTFPWPEDRTDSAIYFSYTYSAIRCNRPVLTHTPDKRPVSVVVTTYSGMDACRVELHYCRG